jgi:hypothetical protein
MKKLLAALALACPLLASATTWVQYAPPVQMGQQSFLTPYYDQDTIKLTPMGIDVWIKNIPYGKFESTETHEQLKYITVHAIVDCSADIITYTVAYWHIIEPDSQEQQLERALSCTR